MARAFAAVVIASWTLAGVGSAIERVAPTDLEAWYNVLAESRPPGLPPASPYPEGTLHVGVTAGTEDSRTYLTLDLGSIPSDASVVGGVLTLPVDPDGGTRSIEAVAMEACFVAKPGPEASGSLEPPPAVDCSVRSSAQRTGTTSRPTFTVDLSPFRERLRDGGLALMPKPAARAEGASWHVALFARDSASEDAVPITATLELELPDGEVGSIGTGPIDSGPGDPPPGASDALDPPSPVYPDFGAPGQLPESSAPPVSDSTPAPEDPSVASPPGDAGASTPSDGPVESAPQLDPAAAIGGQGFKYGAVFGLPLALLVFVWYFGSALTRDPPASKISA